jgi:hypothetical protein
MPARAGRLSELSPRQRERARTSATVPSCSRVPPGERRYGACADRQVQGHGIPDTRAHAQRGGTRVVRGQDGRGLHVFVSAQHAHAPPVDPGDETESQGPSASRQVQPCLHCALPGPGPGSAAMLRGDAHADVASRCLNVARDKNGGHADAHGMRPGYARIPRGRAGRGVPAGRFARASAGR